MRELREPRTFPTDRAAVIELGASERAFVRRLQSAVALGCREVVADVGAVDMVGWSTLAALHRAAKRLRARRGRLAVVVRSEQLRRLLRLTLLTESFAVAGSRDEALRDTRSEDATVELELPADRSFDAVGRLVAAGVGSRAGLGVDRVDDLQLALEAVLHRPDARGTTRLALTASGDDLLVEIGPLATADSGDELRRVLSTLVSTVETRTGGDGVWIRLRFPSGAPATGSR